MNATHKRRIRKLAKFLRTDPACNRRRDPAFDMRWWFHELV